MTKRITHLRDLSANNRPKYDPNACGTGIVHLGVGSFHKAHQAYYTYKVLEKFGGDSMKQLLKHIKVSAKY